MKKLISKLIGAYVNVLALLAPGYAGRSAFLLFCRPFRTKITQRHHQFLNSATQFDIALGTDLIKCYQWGKGPCQILLLHGWQSHTYRWKSYIEAFEKSEYSIFSLDAPGHGLSTGNFMSVPYYNQAIELLLEKVGRPHIVLSHSLGSFTGMYTFYLRPQWAPDKFISLASPGEAKEFFDFYVQQLGLTSYSKRLVIQYFTQAVGNPPSYFSTSAFAANFDFAGLLIHDEEDDETSVENSKQIHRLWKNSKLITPRGKGHNLKSPEIVNMVVRYVKEGRTHHFSDIELAP